MNLSLSITPKHQVGHSSPEAPPTWFLEYIGSPMVLKSVLIPYNLCKNVIFQILLRRFCKIFVNASVYEKLDFMK